FKEAMVLFSGSKYITISLIFSTISQFIYETQPNNKFLITEIEGELDNDDENIKKIIKDNEDFIEISNENSKNKNKMDIFNSIDFQTCVLDLQFKNLRFIIELTKNIVYKELRDIFKDEEEAIKENHEDNELFLPLISRSTPKTYSDLKTIEGSENNDEKENQF
ncbi:4065_t:CDS:2, partial [Funneliformis caledonium]